MCSRAQATTNSFFLFLGSPPGFLFTVTVQQGSHSLSLSLSVPLSSSLTVRALALEASVEMLPKEDRELPESETCPRLSTYSAVSGRTRSQGSYSLSLCSRVHTRITLTFHFLSTHDRTVTKAVGRMQQTNRQSSEPTENTASVDTASHLYAVHAMDG